MSGYNERDNDDGEVEPRADHASASTSPSPVAGMASSVTRHATRHAQISKGPGEIRFCAAAVDTLELSARVTWDDSWTEMEELFDRLKTEASGSGGIPIPGVDALMKPVGFKRYRWHIKFPQADVFVANRQQATDKWPNVRISLGSFALWQNGVSCMAEQFAILLRDWGATIHEVTVSRVDIAADFEIPDGLTAEFLEHHLVGYTGKTETIKGGRRFETFYVGAKGGPVVLRVYHKSLEMAEKPSKKWLHDIWQAKDNSKVWRFEYELRRDFLRRFAIRSAADVSRSLAAVWKYLTTDYLSLRNHDNANTSRRSTLDMWRHVQAVALKLGDLCELTRDIKQNPIDVEGHLRNIAGRAVSVGVGLRIDDLPHLLDVLIRGIREILEEKPYDAVYRQRSILAGYENEVAFGDPA